MIEMASPVMHLAIAKKYLDNNKNINVQEFIKGTLYPDATHDKDKTHYTKLSRGKDVISHLNGKVDLFKFLKEHESLNDFETGWLLHLVTDYLFFDECFNKKYLENICYEDFCKDLYYAYDCLNLYLEKKYNITKDYYKDYPNEYYPGRGYKKCILSKEEIDKFIEHVSSINLEKYIIKIKDNGENIKP